MLEDNFTILVTMKLVPVYPHFRLLSHSAPLWPSLECPPSLSQCCLNSFVMVVQAKIQAHMVCPLPAVCYLLYL